MYKKFYKFLPIISLAPISLAISCTNNSGDNTKVNQNQIVYNLTTASPMNQYFLDTSTELSSRINPEQSLEKTATAASLVRLQTLSSPEYNEQGNIVKAGQVKFKLELAQAVVFTFKDGSTKTFDNDQAEENKDTTIPYVFQQSSNVNSINSEAFKEAAKKAVKMEIKIKDGFYWYDANGEKTQYQVVAEDFWYSYLRTYFTGYFQRAFRGFNGTPAQNNKTDKLARKRLNDQNQKFNSTLYTNGQQFDIHNLSQEKFIQFDEKKFTPVNAVKNNALVFDVLDTNQSTDFFGFFKLMLAQSLIFAGAPSQKIKALAADKKYASTEANEYQYGRSIIHEIALYYYGVDTYKNNLYAGAYLPNATKSTDNVLELKVNPDYLSKGLLNQNNLESILIRYGVNDANKAQSDFLNGSENSVLSYDNLNETNKKAIESNQNQYSYVKFRNYLKSQSIGNSAFNITPAPRDKNNQPNYSQHFNDNYAKLVYGASIEEILQGFKGDWEHYSDRKSISSGVFANQSISFRSLINAAINWDFVKDNSQTSTSKATDLWLSNAAPDANLGGSDQATAKYKTPRDAKDKINSLMPIDKDGNLIDLAKLTPDNNNKNTYKSLYFAEMKKNIKALLDEFYTANNLDSSKDKIQWTIYNTKVLSEQQKQAYAEIIKLIKELDSRLEPKFNLLASQTDINRVIGAVNETGTNAISQYIVYNYEFDTLSPYLDKITHAIGLSPFALLKKFADLNENDNLAKSFPQLTRFAKELKKHQEQGTFRYNEIYDPSVENKFRPLVWSDLDKFNSYEERNLYLRGVYNPESKAWQNTGFGGVGYEWDVKNKIFSTDNIVEQSKYARWFVANSTNEQLVELLRELNTWRAFDITLDKFIDSHQNTDTLITQKTLKVVIPVDNVTYVQDFAKVS